MRRKRFGRAILYSLRNVVPAACTIQAIASGIIEYKTGDPFYTFLLKEPLRWIICVVLLVLALSIACWFAMKKKYPSYRLKEAVNVLSNKRLYFFQASDMIERDSVIEIRKLVNSRNHGDIPYALAFIDRYDDNDPSLMIAQHLALYKEETYINETPGANIEKKNAKDYYYRPYLSHAEFQKIKLDVVGNA